MGFRSVLALALLVPALGRATGPSPGAAIKPHLAEAAAFDYDLAVFEDRGADIFRQLARGERAEVMDRVAYARGQVAAERGALEALQSAFERLEPAAREPGRPPTPPEPGALARVADALEDFLALLDPALVRAVGAYPVPLPRRLLERRSGTPGDEPDRDVARAVGELAERSVRLAGGTLARRRVRFRDALRALQYREGAADFVPQHRLDRAFYALQAGLAVKLDGGLGVPQLPPGDPAAPLVTDPPMRLGPAAAGPGLVLPAVWERVLSASLAPATDPTRAGAEAQRQLDLAALQARFETRVARGESGARDEAWEAYRQLRDRYDRPP